MFGNQLQIEKCTGVSVDIQADDAYQIDLCTVTRAGSKLEIDQSIPGFSDLNEVFKNLPAKSIVAINMVGKGIVHKQLAEEDLGHFDKILPGADPEDFYIQQFVSCNRAFVSVIRKNQADRWIELFRHGGFFPVMLSLGAFPVRNIAEQLNFYDKELSFYGHHLDRTPEGEISGYRYDPEMKAPFAIKVDIEPIKERLVLPYAAAFQLLLANNISPVHAVIPVLAKAFAEHRENKKVKVIAVMILVVFFVLLGLNTVVFSHFLNENRVLEQQVSTSSKDIEGLKVRGERAARNELLLTHFGWDEDASKGMMIDQLASLLPEELTWTELQINPVDVQKSRQDRAVNFFDRRVTVTGNSAAIIAVNEWIARIRALKWVKNVRLESYTFNNELNTGRYKIMLDY